MIVPKENMNIPTISPNQCKFLYDVNAIMKIPLEASQSEYRGFRSTTHAGTAQLNKYSMAKRVSGGGRLPGGILLAALLYV